MQEAMTQQQPEDARILQDIENISGNMSGWLKFLGIINIISGAFTALTLFGIVIAWLPIWLGVLLLQAGNRITHAKLTNNRQGLVTMMDKLRLYFIIQGVLFIVMIAMGVLTIIFFGSFITRFMSEYNGY